MSHAPPSDADTPAPLPLLYHDGYLVIVDKPAGLLVHRTALDAHEQRAALQLVRDQIGAPVWPVHRLDKGTSGVLAFALDVDTARRLGAQFEAGVPRKTYLALVRGWPPAAGEIDHPLARDPERPSAGQPLLAARTRYERLARVEWPFATDARHSTSRYALLQVFPESGRRHQIRRHLKHIAHPLIGDATHGKGAHNRAVASWLGLQRLWLHALALELTHPATGRPFWLQALPDASWRALLAQGAWEWDKPRPAWALD
ncbi:pseudouridine synthase [Azohydromonas caseinilytica]|uniref:Pseudouridine synthase n=1 Tax=Azohydromonas caseinilytica TaxID=2728836 RepID=A0A848F9R5_9BURK|nr:pseudouridine synthase [Azohydromonas caseinilytica]NML15586.1 pseudouridine synthase [Azohydromonas caseinilytica]